MKYFLEKAMQETDKMKKQAQLHCAKQNVVKSKRFDSVRLLFTMLFGQATIIISLFTAISFLFEEEDWIILDKVPFFKCIILELSSISPRWYLESLIIIALAFVLPCVLGWVVALPAKFLPVKTTPVIPNASDYEKRIFEKVNEIKTALDKNEVQGAAIVMATSTFIYAIVSTGVLVYSELYKDGQIVLNKLFVVLLGAVFFLAFIGALMYGLNFLLYLLACTITHSFENEKDTLSRACVFFEREWLKSDNAEREKRAREQQEKIEKKKLEDRKRKEEKEKQDKLRAEAAVWAYQNNYTPDTFSAGTSSLTEDDHDDLDSLTEAMGFDTDVSDM